MTQNKILIPKKNLDAGFKKCHNCVTCLLSDSRKLYDEKRFVSSIALSILAYEEVGKMDFIRMKIKNECDILEKEWKEMSSYGSHSYKLISFYQFALEDVQKLSEDEFNRIVEEEKKRGSIVKFKKLSELKEGEEIIKKRFRKFNDIKKACFYEDWKDEKWFDINDVYNEHELELLANFLLDFTEYELYTEILNYRYPFNFFHQVPKEVNIMMKDEIWLERDKYVKTVYTTEYHNFLNVINYLIDRFPKSFRESN